MRAPLSWLRDYAPFDQPVEVLAAALSALGLVVEGIDRIGEGLDEVVVAHILDIRRHPNADRIRLVDVDAGDGEPLQIACGAWNMEVGDLVPLARIGAVLPGGREIKRAKMRGEWSNGMLCAPDELGLPAPAGHDGLMILPPGSAAPGTPMLEVVGGADVVFDLEVSPNRPDALCMAGVARDLAAALHVPFGWPVGVPGDPAATVPPVDRTVEGPRVEVEAPDRCARFTATVIDGVPSGASPAWLAARLARAGMRSISLVVDVSNYVMLDLGQPNHAYDLDRLAGRGLSVRLARDGEALVTLDGQRRALTADDLLICDAEGGPVGIAGVMGGADSEVGEQTRSVLLEAAWFDPGSVARTGIRVGLQTEARYRFERGVDPELTERSVDRFVQLLAAASGAAVRRGPTLDVRSDADLPAQPVVEVRTDRVNLLLGTALGDEEIADLLRPIGFEVTPAGPGRARVGVPTWRPDTAREVDVIEEVARHHGYERIPRRRLDGPSTGALSAEQRERRAVRDVLAGAGLDEAWTSTFLSPEDLARAGVTAPAVAVTNPLDRDQSLLRPSLLPGLLDTVRLNADRQQPDVRLFELGRTFAPPAAGAGPTPEETERLAAVLAGRPAPEAVRLWQVLAVALRLEGTGLRAAEAPGWHPTRTAAISDPDGAPIGLVGELDPDLLAAAGLPGRVAAVEVDLDAVLGLPRRPRIARPLSRYPASDLDLAFAVPDTVPAADVAATLGAAAGELLESLRLFDVYRGPGVGEGRRSLAFRLRLRSPERTLDEQALAAVRDGAVAAVVEGHGAQLRG